MTITIPPILAGVLLTLAVEFAIILIYAAIKKDRKNREE